MIRNKGSFGIYENVRCSQYTREHGTDSGNVYEVEHT
jgi:hypothetical protein